MVVSDKLNLTMLCDFYELTMGAGYFANGYADRITYFDLFFRRWVCHRGRSGADRPVYSEAAF